MHTTVSSTFCAVTVCVLTAGCGFTLNTPPVPAAVTGVTSEAGPIIPAPAFYQALTGCSNPNTGVSNGDWGVGTAPVYTTVDNTAPVVGRPVYTSNTIFWISRENGPGQSILLTGAFTDASKTARIALIPAGTQDWQARVQASKTVIATTQQSTTALSFFVPAFLQPGVYGFEIEDPGAPPLYGLANVPALHWAVGIPSATGPETALQHPVYDCGVEQGGMLRIFGKNFTAADQVVLQAPGGAATVLTPVKADTNAITVTIPTALAAGSYKVWVGTSPWSATSSPAAQITVYAPTPLFVQNVTCSGLVGDGVTDNTARLQSCLDRYAPIGGATDLVVDIAVPAGKFVLTGVLTGHSREVLIGVSPSETNFLGEPKGLPPTAWFNLPQYFGMANLSFVAPVNPNLLLSTGTASGNPSLCGHLYFSNVHFASTTDASHGSEVLFGVAGPDIQIYNSYFLSNSNQSLDLTFADGAIISGSSVVLNNWTGLSIADSQNVIFENNQTYSQNPPQNQANGHAAGSGLSVSRSFNRFGPSAVSRDVYIGYNTFEGMGSNDQQVITNDGDGGAYLGPVASSTASTITLAYDPAWDWMGTTNPEAAILAVAYGTGVGQYSFLKNYSGRTINLETPLQVLPDQSSIVVIAQYELNMTIAHNQISNTLGASVVLGDALEGVIEDNVLTNSGQGILISAFGPYGGPAAYGPVINTDVLRNTLAVGKGNLITPDYGNYIWGIGIQDFPGCLLSGLMVRNNVVPSQQVIYNTDGVNGISGNVIELNQANWQPTFPTPGFLIQDNSPPPP
jgi:hypothetical protein